MELKPHNEHGGSVAHFVDVGDQALHGDVIIEKISAMPEDFLSGQPDPLNALALGEASGHAHQLQGTQGVDFDLRVNNKGERHLRVVTPTMLKHPEHEKMLLPPGDYKIDIQREYNPWEKLTRRVID